MQDGLRPGGLNMQWGFPLALGDRHRQTGAAAQRRAHLAQRPTLPLSADVAPVSDAISASSSLLTDAGVVLPTAQSVDALLWLL